MFKRIEAIFSGRVQGVGFRFTAERFAQQLNLVGWVKNLDNGDVELVAEGREEDLEKLLDSIKKYFSSYIRDASLDWKDPTGEFSEFKISF